MRNRGWELSLNYRGKIGKDIDYSIGGSLSDAISEVTEYVMLRRMILTKIGIKEIKQVKFGDIGRTV